MSSRGNSPSRSGSPRPSAGPGSPHRPSSPASGAVTPLGYDPARMDPKSRFSNTRMELPADAYLPPGARNVFTMRKNVFNTEGQTIEVEVNQYRLTSFDYSKKIYQFDVALSPEPQKFGPVVKKVFAHPDFIAHMKQFAGHTWLFDGKKLAWSATPLDRGETRVKIDLDAGRPVSTRPGANQRRSNEFYVIIRQTTAIDMSVLKSFLEGRLQFDTKVQEALNFMDHLLRQGPSQHRVAIRRNFYDPDAKPFPLQAGDIIEVHKGIYASIRLSQNLSGGGMGLALNADVANTCFWVGGSDVGTMIPKFLASCDNNRWRQCRFENLQQELRPVMTRAGLQSSDAFKHLRKLRKLKFKVRHRGGDDQVYTINDFTFDPSCGPEGANAKTKKFQYEGQLTSIEDYYKQRYKTHLRNPYLPLIDAGKDRYFPMEVAIVERMQRYPFKLNPDQTAAMIKIAVTRPPQRRQHIEQGVAGLGLARDNWLRYYGVQFEQKFTKVQAKLHKAPVINFGKGTIDPGFSGRWDLRGKTFSTQNRAPLQNWGFLTMDSCVDLPTLQQFARTFKQTYLGHGGLIRADPVIIQTPGEMRGNAGDAVNHGFQEVQQRTKGYPQLLFVVVAHKNSPHYQRIKKSCDIRFGILSQVVNAQAVRANQGQYHSNVCMKVNAKLGGATSRTAPPWKTGPQSYFQKRTMIVGVDVSHAAPGSDVPSVAAMTMSVDKQATRYAGLAETNGHRVEMMTEATVDYLFRNLLKTWSVEHQGPPEHIIYMRDGVDEGQFAQILQYEIEGIKAVLKERGAANVLFTVIVATKRHHIRFFPTSGDKNGNAKPGTIVEKEVTHPFMLDWYTCSHVAIQGTARPVHYHVLRDDAKMELNQLQKMLYHQCYSYVRSTTPVSLHPAVYYAHLVSDRARAHEKVASSGGFRAGGKGHEMARDAVAKGMVSEGPSRGRDAASLMSLGGLPTSDQGSPAFEQEMRQRNFIRSAMWYI